MMHPLQSQSVMAVPVEKAQLLHPELGEPAGVHQTLQLLSRLGHWLCIPRCPEGSKTRRSLALMVRAV